ncbi:MAG: hypothetical protein EBT03_07390, partial [Betaproteobacteria bacterium]|nr:hypothetical protein [Betaproteobacteria bacterium]
MQRLTQRVIDALNNLPGFPPKPTTNPPQDGQFILGDYLYEIHVRPEVANFAAMPLVGNALGDIRASLADQAWYIWDGAAWQPMGGGGGGAVNSVTASAPLSSSGGANPNISFSSWPANASGALTNDGAGNLSWTAPSAPGAVDLVSTATVALAAGEIVRFTSGGVEKADATDAANQLEPIGFATAAAGIGAPVSVRVAGLVDVPAALFDVAPIAANVGERVWLSTTAGQITLTAPSVSGDVVQRVGVLA